MIIGTRPEAIKLASVVRALEGSRFLAPVVISTGQHRDLLQSTMEGLDLEAQVDLDVMAPGQSLDELCSRIHDRLPRALADLAPHAVLVQGDTTTAMTAALCAFHARIPVGHVEAGLRTLDLDSPFPEEANRQIVGRVARWSFAPTEGAAENLRKEGIDERRILVTGNTAIDTLLQTCGALSEAVDPERSEGANQRLLITLHRRESFGEPLQEILHGVADFLEEHPNAEALWPVHPNPQVQDAIRATRERGASLDRIEQVAPLPYPAFCRELRRCHCVLTDSGGIQEEAPSLGKRVLVAREETERPEAVDAGLNVLVGRRRANVQKALEGAWSEAPYDGPWPAPNPYGDGQASQRIVDRLEHDLRR